MDETSSIDESWAAGVVVDLAAALRRDGLIKSAEMLDDVAITIAQEHTELMKDRGAQNGSGQAALRLIVS